MTLPVLNQNWLSFSGFTNVLYGVTSASYPLITTWTAGTYNAGSIVTGPDSNQYQAVVETDAQPPAPGQWVRTAYTTPDKGLLAQSCVPLNLPPVWNGQTVYPPGAQVLFGENAFVTPNGSSIYPPPPEPGNNSSWEYMSGSQFGYAASFYVGSSPTTYAGIEFYDQNGALIAAPCGMGPSGAVIALPFFERLADTTPEMNGVYDNTLQLAWTANPTGFWAIDSGMLYPNPGYSGSQKIKLLYVTDTRANCNIGITFQSDVANASVADNGILFRLSDTNNYWMASRGKLQKLVAGVLTTVATYTRLPVGSRMFVQAVGSVLTVYAYPGNAGAPVQVATATDSFNSTATNHGVYYQVF